jgi:ABC-type amino acid transport substrate-binding protein
MYHLNLFKPIFMLLCLAAVLSACSLNTTSQSDEQGRGSAADNQVNPGFKPHSNSEISKRVLTDADYNLLPQEFKRIYQRGKIVIAMYKGDRYPYFFPDAAGNPVGSDVDLAYDIASKLGVDVEFLRTASTFDEVADQVAAGQADIAVSKLSITLPRAQKVLFSEPYLLLHQSLLVNRLQFAAFDKNQSDPLEVIRKNSVKIGVVKGTSYVGYAHELSDKAETVEYDNVNKMMEAAYRGEVFAAFYDDVEINSYIDNNPDRAIRLQAFVLRDRVDPIAIAVAPNDSRLLAWLNQLLFINNAKSTNQ